VIVGPGMSDFGGHVVTFGAVRRTGIGIVTDEHGCARRQVARFDGVENSLKIGSASRSKHR
jgi:hypothetical protein